MSVTKIRLQPDIGDPLEKLSKKLDRSKNYLINQAIKEYIGCQIMEDICCWADTLVALKSVQMGKTVSGDQALSWLESRGTDRELSQPKKWCISNSPRNH